MRELWAQPAKCELEVLLLRTMGPKKAWTRRADIQEGVGQRVQSYFDAIAPSSEHGVDYVCRKGRAKSGPDSRYRKSKSIGHPSKSPPLTFFQKRTDVLIANPLFVQRPKLKLRLDPFK